MLRINFSAILRGLALCICAVTLAVLVLPPSTVRGGGLAACAVTVYDEVLSALGLTDGQPTPQRVNGSGALWTADSDLADTIITGTHVVTTGAESNFVLPLGTREFGMKLRTLGSLPATATDWITVGFVAGTRQIFVDVDNTFPVIRELDLGTSCTSVFTASAGGSVRIGWWCTVSQNPD